MNYINKAKVRIAIAVAMSTLTATALEVSAERQEYVPMFGLPKNYEIFERNWETNTPLAFYNLVGDYVKSMETNTAAISTQKDVAPMLEYVLSKGLEPKEGVDIEDIGVVRNLMFLLYADVDRSSDLCRTNTLCLITSLMRIDDAIIKGFVPKERYLKVWPPYVPKDYRGGPVFPSMNPEVITDPEMKARYIEAIHQNNKNIIEAGRQKWLKENLSIYEMSSPDIVQGVRKAPRENAMSEAIKILEEHERNRKKAGLP